MRLNSFYPEKEEQAMGKPSVITIDGPAGSGKSTIGALLAQRLGYTYFDTGVMYRAVTFIALQHNLDCHDEPAMEQLAQTMQIEVCPPTHNDGRQYTIYANGQDITWSIRSPDVDRNVSMTSRYPGVRTALIRQQKAIGQKGNIVMIGRDIGTIVMPDAPLKIYLQTSLEERSRRRLVDLQAKGYTMTRDEVEADLARRDRLDEHVMRPANDAWVVNTDTPTPNEVVDRIVALFDTGISHVTQGQPPSVSTMEEGTS